MQLCITNDKKKENIIYSRGVCAKRANETGAGTGTDTDTDTSTVFCFRVNADKSCIMQSVIIMFHSFFDTT